MGEICGEIAERLSALWTLGVEEGLEIPLVHKTLRLCLHIINKTSGCGSRRVVKQVDPKHLTNLYIGQNFSTFQLSCLSEIKLEKPSMSCNVAAVFMPSPGHGENSCCLLW